MLVFYVRMCGYEITAIHKKKIVSENCLQGSTSWFQNTVQKHVQYVYIYIYIYIWKVKENRVKKKKLRKKEIPNVFTSREYK